MRQCKSNEVVCTAIVGEVDVEVVVKVPTHKGDDPEIVGVFLAATKKEQDLKTLFEEVDYDLWSEVEEEYNDQADSMEE